LDNIKFNRKFARIIERNKSINSNKLGNILQPSEEIIKIEILNSYILFYLKIIIIKKL